MKIALIGFEQAGKRTLFTLLTGRDVLSEVRGPGEVIEGVADIRDPRVDRLAELCAPERTVYAQNNFVLVPDAVAGAGSREWLDAARRCDLLCLVVRAFASDQVYHPAGSVDAARDQAELESEILLADMETVERRLTRLEKEKRAGLDAQQQVEIHALGKLTQAFEAEETAGRAGLDPQEEKVIRSLGLLTFKPVLTIHNVSEDALDADVGPRAMAVSCLIEEEIMTMDDPADRQEYLKSLGLQLPGVDRVNAAAYDAQGLMSFYTTGKDECRAWTIRKGSTAPVAGGKVHSDIERGFIRVEVIKYDDFVAAGSEKAAKDAGRMQVKGKDYVIEDGDVCHFLFNV